jgi:hypothetical protein
LSYRIPSILKNVDEIHDLLLSKLLILNLVAELVAEHVEVISSLDLLIQLFLQILTMLASRENLLTVISSPVAAIGKL